MVDGGGKAVKAGVTWETAKLDETRGCLRAVDGSYVWWRTDGQRTGIGCGEQ